MMNDENHLRATRQYASLQQSAGWLATALQVEAGGRAQDGTIEDRLRNFARELCWAGEGRESLAEFAQDFPHLMAEGERLLGAGAKESSAEEMEAAAQRFERAASIALALYVDSQARHARQSAELAQNLPDESDEAGRQRHLAEIGASVRARLDADPRARKAQVDHLELYLVRDFLDEDECTGLMALIDRDCYPSGLLGQNPDKEFRTSNSCNLDLVEPLVDLIDGRLASYLGIHRRFSETMQGQRYEVGQQFKPHHDFFHRGEGYYEDAQRQGGQRSWTAMLFLNKPEAGGCTNFPQVSAKVAPERGTLLLWNNMKPDGSPNYNSLHQGMPVEAGTKYVLTKWFRERPWI